MKSTSVKPLIAIVGETASGKSTLAMVLAEEFGGEIICADSWTVYRGFDIGTAKPTKSDRTKVPHHLLDVADPAEGFSAAVFQRMAHKAIAEIIERGNLPIMVGGTGLYIDSVLYNYSFLPRPSSEIRELLTNMSLDELIQRVAVLGLDTTGIDLRNKRRIIRLIENNGVRPSKQSIRGNTLILGIQVDNETTKKRIAERIEQMMDLGLEAEVERLSAEYGWEVEPMKGIGYREWREYFAGTQTIEETQERILKASIDLAKRQRTWFKRNQSIQWLSDRSKYVDTMTTFLNKSD